MKNLFTIITFFTMVLTSCAQQPKGNDAEENAIIIGDFMILPKLKEIRAYKMIGGQNWDGFTYEKDPKINYATTTLLIIDEFIFFKEYFPFKFDLNTLSKLLKNDLATICRDKNSLYFLSTNIQYKKIDLSNYQTVNDFIYKNSEGKLFFLDTYEFKLKPLDISIDLKTLKNISYNYFYDKNGLYIFGSHDAKVNNERKFIETSSKLLSGQFEPIIAKKHFTYGDHVFAISSDTWVRELSLNSKKAIEVIINDSESFISDGETVYSDLNYGYEEDEKNGNGYYGLWYPALYANVNLQKIYNPKINFQRDQKNSSTILVNKYDPNNFPGLLVKITDKYYLLNEKKKYPITKAVFYHPENGQYETFDDQYLTVYNFEGFMKYRNMLYFDGIPVDLPNFYLEKLTEIKGSNYLTDGKNIINLGSIGGYGSIDKGKIEFATFTDRILENVYHQNMRSINEDLLSDGKTIITNNKSFKIEDLKLKTLIIQ